MRNPESRARAELALRVALHKLHDYLVEPGVIEILLNPDGSVWVERLGSACMKTATRMTPLEAENMLREVAAAVGKQLTAASPSLLCRLPIYGARLQAVIPPIVAAPTFAMRRPAEHLIPLERYIEQRVLTERHATLLRDAVLGQQNILVGGSTGSGKTTITTSLLNELSGTDERVLIIEDYPELQCNIQNKVPMLIDPPDYTWRDAVRNAMRLRPDRIICAEIVDGAAHDVSKAWLTHKGGLATIHGNSPKLMLERFSLLTEEVVANAPRETIAETIDFCVHMQRDRSAPAGRAITGIVRVRGYDRAARQWLVDDLT